MAKRSIPTVDLADFTSGQPARAARFVDVLGKGLTEFGFVVVQGHGVGSELIHDCYAQVKTFFALPQDVKKSYEPAASAGQRGYTGFGKEHAKSSNIGDLKEFWHVGRERFSSEKIQARYPKNVWPDAHVPGFRPALSQLWDGLEGMASHLLEATSLYLGLERNTLPGMIKDGNTILRALHYPPLRQEDAVSGAVRAAAHEDINFITILCEATDSGLELLTHDGEWMAIESKPGQMVVDSGDMLKVLTNDVIPATTHRVVNPHSGKNVPRYSMPFFVHAYHDCDLSVLPQCTSPARPPKFAPILADEFLQQRLREIGLVKA